MKDETFLKDEGQKGRMLALALIIAAALLFVVWVLPVASTSSATNVGGLAEESSQSEITATDSYTVYLPLLPKDPPSPRVVANVSLPGAKCPNAVGANPVSGYVYVANTFSANVNVLSGKPCWLRCPPASSPHLSPAIPIPSAPT